MTHSPELLDWLAQSVVGSRKPFLEESAACTLLILASLDEKEVNQKIADFPGLLDKLKQVLDVVRDSAFKSGAAVTLSSLPQDSVSMRNKSVLLMHEIPAGNSRSKQEIFFVVQMDMNHEAIVLD